MFLLDAAFMDCHIQFTTLLKTVITCEFLSEIQMQPVEFNAHQIGVEWIGICWFLFYLELYGQRNAPPLKVCRVQLCSSTQMILSSNKVQEYFTDGS